MKKLTLTLTCLIIMGLLCSMATNVSAKVNNSVTVYIDQQELKLDVPAYVEDGNTMVPLRPIFETLGLIVEWTESVHWIQGSGYGKEIEMWIGSKSAKVNEHSVELPVAPVIVKGTTFVPLRFIGEATGNEVKWDPATRSALITTVKPPLKEIVIMNPQLYWIPDESHPVYSKIKQTTGVKLIPIRKEFDINNLSLEPGRNPDVIIGVYGFDWYIESDYTSVVRNKVSEGYFWDLTDKIKKYPNLTSIPSQVYENIKMQDGRIYGVPMPKALTGKNVPFIRRDWLDKLNLPVPKNMQELYDVAKAFVNEDPDGNGKNDTVGILNISGADQINWIVNVFNESNGRFKAKDGKIIDTYMEPETLEALEWLRSAYREGLFPRSFDSLYHSTRASMSDRVGVRMQRMSWYPAGVNTYGPIFEAIPYLLGPSGVKVAPAGSGYSEIWQIPATVEEDKVDVILGFLDFLASPEGIQWRENLLGQIPQDTGSSADYTYAQRDSDTPVFELLKYLDFEYDKYENGEASHMTDEQSAYVHSVIDEMEAIAISDVAHGLYSDVRAEVEDRYNFALQDLMVAVIYGNYELQDWTTGMNVIKADPDYQQMMTEFNESWQIKAKHSK